MDKVNLCDLYFDEDTNTLKNSKEEVVAFMRNGAWELTAGTTIVDTYCMEYQQGIRDVITQNAKLTPEKILIKLKQVFSSVKKHKIEYDELIKDAAIALDLDHEDIQSLQRRIEQILKKLGVKAAKIKNPHVSTAYLLGYNSYADLAETIKTIANYPYEFKVAGVEILSGATTEKDYLVLKLEAPQAFYKALNVIEQHTETVKFPGGFKTHLSLFSLNKGLNDLQKEALKSQIVEEQLTLNHVIQPQSVSLFNNSKLLELRQRLRKTIKG